MDADHVLDPDGDILLVLKNPEWNIAIWPMTKKQSRSRKSLPAFVLVVKSNANVCTDGTSNGNASANNVMDWTANVRDWSVLPDYEPVDTSADVEPDDEEVTFFVSSKHLKLASRYFRTALSGPWNRDMDGDVRRWEVHSWDQRAFLMVMQMIHGRTDEVEERGRMSWDMAAKVALVVDFYQCHVPVYAFAKLWMEDVRRSDEVKTIDCDLILCMFVSFVFGLDFEFTMCTRAAMELATGPIPSLGLPFPEALVSRFQFSYGPSINVESANILFADTMEESRRAYITRVGEGFKKIHQELSNGKHGCSPSCRLSLHRALFENVDTRIINKDPHEFFTARKVIKILENIRDPYDMVYKGHKGPYLKAVR